MSRAALAPASAAFRVPPVRRRAQGKWSPPVGCRLLKRPLRVDHQGMDPPTEQLIRDYLNRLSLASKAHLEPRDPAVGRRASESGRQIWPPPGVPAIGYPLARSPVPMQPLTPAPMQPFTPAAMQPLPPWTANLPVAASRQAHPSNGSPGNGPFPPASSGLSRLAEPASSADPSGTAGGSAHDRSSW